MPSSFDPPESASPRRAPDEVGQRDAADFVTGGGAAGTALEGSGLYTLLVESVRDYAIFALDPTGHVLSWNEGARRIKGYEASEIIGKHFSTFYPPEDVARGKTE